MNRYKKRFAELKRKKARAFIPFVVLGDPDYAASLKIVKELLKFADILELGMAFSDPIADGKTIQGADSRALGSGINPEKAFKLIKKIRGLDKDIPIGLLVYYNLIYRRGIDRFYEDAKKAGVDGILAADVPLEEAGPLLKAAKKYHINQIFLVTPTTTEKRLRNILSHTSGFVYLVTLLGVTGARQRLQQGTIKLIRRVRPYTKLPICAGFGIARPEHVKAVVRAGADGAIVGSAIVDLIAKDLKNRKKMLNDIIYYAKEMKQATK